MNIESGTEVYLTGGTGFLGSHLRKRLAEQGADVTLLARPESDVTIQSNERVQRGDVTDRSTFTIENHEIVFHLAALTSIEQSVSNPQKVWEVNSDGTLNVLESARACGVDRFVYASTASVYGPPKYLPIDEKHPTDPAEPYGASKLAGDGLVRSYSSTYDLSTVVARIFNAFGPRQPSYNVVPTIITQALNNGVIELGNLSPSRDFIYVADVINALLTIAEKGNAGVPYNIGRGEAVTIKTMAETVVSLIDSDIDIVSLSERQRSGDIEIPRHEADTSRIRNLGWKPEYGIRDGLKETIEFCR